MFTLLGNGDGSFRSGVGYVVSGADAAVAIADFSADGKPDVAVASFSTVAILVGNGDGTLQPSIDYAVGSDPRWMATADFNLDGKPDLVTANRGSDDVSVLINTTR